MVSLNPVQILAPNAEEDRGEHARLSAFIGGIAIGDLVKSTLGPKGMDKILVGQRQHGNVKDVTVTNDGATILKNVGVDNPAAKVLIEISQTQDSQVGDGTTSVVVLAAELLKEAENLVSQKIHPQVIVAGWRKAAIEAEKALLNSSKLIDSNDDALRPYLLKIAGTTLSSKILSQHKEQFAKIAVDAILRLKGSGHLQAIQIIKKSGGKLSDCYLDDGFLLDKQVGLFQPKRIENAKILISNTPMDTDKIKVFGSRVKVDSTAKVAEIEAAEKQKMKEKVNKILAHNCNVFINRQLIYNYPEQLFADANIMAIEHADFEGIERLALVLGGEIVSTFDSPDKVKLGSCKLIEEVFVGEDKMLKFSGVTLGEACSIVLRGATEQIVEEADRSLHDALCVLQQTVSEPRVTFGGGASEMLMAEAVSQLAARTPGKEAIAIESFAKALRQLPTAIADNAGYDSAEIISNLRSEHTKGNIRAGIDVNRFGEVGNMEELGIVESYRVKSCVVRTSAEAAEQIVRVDEIIKAPPRPRQPDHCG